METVDRSLRPTFNCFQYECHNNDNVNTIREEERRALQQGCLLEIEHFNQATERHQFNMTDYNIRCCDLDG